MLTCEKFGKMFPNTSAKPKLSSISPKPVPILFSSEGSIDRVLYKQSPIVRNINRNIASK